jgi:hypothetical protein
MPEEVEKKEELRGDAEAGQKLDKLLSYCDSLSSRLDGITKRLDDDDARRRKDDDDAKKRNDDDDDAARKRHDALKHRKDAGENLTEEEEKELKGESKEVVADKKGKKDDDDDAKGKKDDDDDSKRAKDDDDGRKDSRSDSEIRSLVASAVNDVLPKPLTDAEIDELAAVQSRADAVLAQHGKHAPRPLLGDTPLAYARRMVDLLKPYSKRWAAIPLTGMDATALAAVEAQVYADAAEAARDPAAVPPGQLRQHTEQRGGHTIISYHGSPSAWMDQLSGPTRQRVTGSFKSREGSN